jgi:hypothetical protein
MMKTLVRVFSILVALLMLLLGYVLVRGIPTFLTPAKAHNLEMPLDPKIVYLVPVEMQRGLLTQEFLETKGAIRAENWLAVRTLAQIQPLDAIIVDNTLIASLSLSDKSWLQDQFKNGVIIVGLGTDDTQFAQVLGLKTLTSPQEHIVPLDDVEYRLVMMLALGDSQEIAAIGDWISRNESGDMNTPIVVQKPMELSFAKMRGRLDSNEGLEGLFANIISTMQGVYAMRNEYQQRVDEASKGTQP